MDYGWNDAEILALRPVMRDKRLKGPSKLCYRTLWLLAGKRPAYIIVRTDILGLELGKSRRAAEKWLEQLKEDGLIDIVDRDPRLGTIHVYVYAPNPGERVARPDPQPNLPFPETTLPEDASLDLSARFGDANLDLSAQQGPGLDLSARKGPDLSARKGPGQKPEVQSRQGDRDLSLDLSARKGPRHEICVNGTNESNELPIPKCHRIPTNESNGSGTAPVGLAGATTLVVEALNSCGKRTNKVQQKRALQKQICQVCYPPPGGEPLSTWVSGAAADLVVFHGVPLADLEHVLADIEAMRGAETLRDAPSLFHFKAKELARRLGKPWPKSKSIET